MYKMSPKKVFDVLRQLTDDEVISTATAKMIAATYAERQIDTTRPRRLKPLSANSRTPLNATNSDAPVICTTCGQTILPF